MAETAEGALGVGGHGGGDRLNSLAFRTEEFSGVAGLFPLREASYVQTGAGRLWLNLRAAYTDDVALAASSVEAPVTTVIVPQRDVIALVVPLASRESYVLHGSPAVSG
ncbi:MAG: hypothetical protein V2I25_03910, partial [Woeseiaceae bacterium]|nr:hypothetical protein [Woeseiaceae bacterium]